MFESKISTARRVIGVDKHPLVADFRFGANGFSSQRRNGIGREELARARLTRCVVV